MLSLVRATVGRAEEGGQGGEEMRVRHPPYEAGLWRRRSWLGDRVGAGVWGAVVVGDVCLGDSKAVRASARVVLRRIATGWSGAECTRVREQHGRGRRARHRAHTDCELSDTHTRQSTPLTCGYTSAAVEASMERSGERSVILVWRGRTFGVACFACACGKTYTQAQNTDQTA